MPPRASFQPSMPCSPLSPVGSRRDDVALPLQRLLFITRLQIGIGNTSQHSIVVRGFGGKSGEPTRTGNMAGQMLNANGFTQERLQIRI